MVKILITGSSTGLGALAAMDLLAQHNDVVLHARNQERAEAALKRNPMASGVLIGDLSKLSDIRSIAQQANQIDSFDVVIHNAGVNSSNSMLTSTVNIMAPYMLTGLMNRPKRLIYVSSGMHRGASLDIENLESTVDYSGSKLALLMLMKYVSNRWTNTIVNAVDPGWVPTRMGGSAANDDLKQGYSSQVWLATGNDSQALKTGNYYYHKSLSRYDQRVDNQSLQRELIQKLETLTDVKF
ncbi:SDR family NAD(P)-dependent oxidoreductase [Companilactobacillus sp. HBUAS56275]|uniref:SDR family NAD(P)-dependent oxidoreductase n=1 Tax=Candidatus Companilactobacillus pullicola TaxID=2838523 RepID=A0A9D1ZMI0_9LACO|nr:SDR family NAD(P)-dependent oxidoreductase [Candidatus Companilactobacillus pullicola]